MSDSFNDEDSFMFNCLLVGSICQLMSNAERVIIRSWIEKLRAVKDGNQKNLRNEYMWALLRFMHKRNVPFPFNRVPYDGDLKPLTELLPEGAIDDVLKSDSKSDLAWIKNIKRKPSTRRRKTIVGPAAFIKSNQRLEDGILCYMAVFSDPS